MAQLMKPINHKLTKSNAMKNSILIMALILISFGAKAVAGEKSTSYVKTDKEVYIGEDLKVGLFNTKVISLDGTVTKVPNRDVVAYMHNSRMFEYLPVTDKSNNTTSLVKMEYITTRGGLNLYRQCCYENDATKFDFYIYKSGEFHLYVDKKNAPTTLPFFGIRVVS